MKLVSDFDGIWTNQGIEAQYVWDYIINSLSGLSGTSVTEAENTLNDCKLQMNKEPYKYGWYYNNTIAAFYQEDPFGDNNAIFDFIDKSSASDINCKKIKEAVMKKYPTLAEYSKQIFYESTDKFKKEGRLKPVESTKDIIEKLRSINTEVVVVSNSKTEKIESVFAKSGLKVSTENTGSGDLRARGDSGKFMIENDYTDLPEYLKINSEFSVALRRKKYHKILAEEKPDYVIGDVFSLDIALPLYLRVNDKEFSDLKVIQRLQTYTPSWVRDYLGRDEFKNIAFMVDNVEEAPEIISQNT